MKMAPDNANKYFLPIGKMPFVLNVWVVSYVLAAMIGIYFENFSVLICMIAATVCTGLLSFCFSFESGIADEKSDTVVALGLLLLCALTNWSGSFYPTAGQDPGLYNLLSIFYLKNGAPWGMDPIWQFLEGASKEYYTAMGGARYPGLVGLGEDKYASNFYPAFPSILSLFSFVFGKYSAGYGQSFLGFLAVFNLYAFLRCANVAKRWATFVAVLFALNPQRIFFSGFPCSETMAVSVMFFSLMSLYLGLRHQSMMMFVVSALGWTVFYLTRMNFYFYFPLLVLILGICNYFYSGKLRSYIYVYITLLFALFLLSHLVYVKHFPELLWTYSPLLIPIWGDKWQQYQLLTLGVLYVLSMGFVLVSTGKVFQKVFDFGVSKFSHFVWAGIGVIGILFLDRLHAISYTAQYAGQDMNAIWKFIDQGYKIGLYHMSLVGIFFSLGPVLAAILGWIVCKTKSLNNLGKIILGALVYFGVLFSAKDFYVNYYYYYSRYFYGEIIPLIYLLLGIGGYLVLKDVSKNNKIFIGVSSLAVLLAVLGTLPLLNGYEGPSKKFFKEVESKTTNQDLIVVDNSNLWPRNEVLPGLIFFLDRKVFVLKSLEDLKLDSVKNLIQKFGKVVVLTQNKPSLVHETLDYDFQIYSGSRRHLFEGLNTLSETKYTWPKVLPNKSVVKRATYYFYELSKI